MPHLDTSPHLVQVRRQAECGSHPARLLSWRRGLDLNGGPPGYGLQKAKLSLPDSWLEEAAMISRRTASVESEDVFRLCQTFDKRGWADYIHR